MATLLCFTILNTITLRHDFLRHPCSFCCKKLFNLRTKLSLRQISKKLPLRPFASRSFSTQPGWEKVTHMKEPVCIGPISRPIVELLRSIWAGERNQHCLNPLTTLCCRLNWTHKETDSSVNGAKPNRTEPTTDERRSAECLRSKTTQFGTHEMREEIFIFRNLLKWRSSIHCRRRHRRHRSRRQFLQESEKPRNRPVYCRVIASRGDTA